MISYELAKQLKDAGFPGIKEVPKDTGGLDIYIPTLSIPTLSELIEACPFSRKYEKANDDKFILWWSGEKWIAGYYTYGDELYVDDYPHPSESGSTPEEAVAKLWLELNKK